METAYYRALSCILSVWGDKMPPVLAIKWLVMVGTPYFRNMLKIIPNSIVGWFFSVILCVCVPDDWKTTAGDEKMWGLARPCKKKKMEEWMYNDNSYGNGDNYILIFIHKKIVLIRPMPEIELKRSSYQLLLTCFSFNRILLISPPVFSLIFLVIHTYMHDVIFLTSSSLLSY